jgi:uncharacterized protein YhfF
VSAAAAIGDLVSFAFGDTPQLNDEYLVKIIAGTKTAGFAPLRDLGPGGEPMPVIGQRYVILDGQGRPGAVIEETDVFGCLAHELSDAFMRECGAEDVPAWRARQVAYIDKHGGWSEDLELVCDRFKLVEVLPR